MASFTVRVHEVDGPKDTRLTGSTSVVGRRKTSQVLISDKSVSGKHGEFRFDGREVSFVDVGSTNGTFTEDGDRLTTGEPFVLMVGELLQLGDIDVELMDVEVKRAPAPAPPPPSDEGMEATSMLDAGQMAALLGDEMGGAAPPAPSSAPSGRRERDRRRAEPEQPRQRREPSGRRQPQRRREPEPERRRPERREPERRRPEPEMVPVAAEEEDDWAAQAAAGDDDDWAAQASGGGDDWAAQAARGGAPSGRSSRPKPPRSGGVQPDELEELDDAGFGEAAKGLILGAINGAIDCFKGWGDHREAGFGEIKEDFGAAWEVFQPTMKESPLPIAAFAGAAGLFTILGLFIDSLSGIMSSLASLIGVVSILATAGTYVYFLRLRIGQPITPIEAVMAVLGDWKRLAIMLLTCAAAVIPGAIAVLIPGMMLAAFIIPVYYIEDRDGFAPARRSLWLFKQDFRRILLSLIALGVATSVVTSVFVSIMTSMGAVVGTIGVLLGAALQGFLGAFSAAYTLELYFDVRARYDSGDAEEDVAENLGDAE